MSACKAFEPSFAPRFPDRVNASKTPMSMSKRKLESYKRAEIVAQASRQILTTWNTPRMTQEMVDLWSGAIVDWMNVTGKLKWDTPKRRGRSR